jgi:hypothetical protein
MVTSSSQKTLVEDDRKKFVYNKRYQESSKRKTQGNLEVYKYVNGTFNLPTEEELYNNTPHIRNLGGLIREDLLPF